METLEGGLIVHGSLPTDVSFVHLNGPSWLGTHGTSGCAGRGAKSIWLRSRSAGVVEYCQKGGAAYAPSAEVQGQSSGPMADVSAESERHLDERACQVPTRLRKTRTRTAGSSTRSEQGFPCGAAGMDAEQRRAGLDHGSEHGGPVGEHATRLGTGGWRSVAVHFAKSYGALLTVCASTGFAETTEARTPGAPEPVWCQSAMGGLDGETREYGSEHSQWTRTLWTPCELWGCSSPTGRGWIHRVACCCSHSRQSWRRDSGISHTSRPEGAWDNTSSDWSCPTQKGYKVGYQRNGGTRSSAGAWTGRKVGQETRADSWDCHDALWWSRPERATAEPACDHYHRPGIRRRARQCEPERYALAWTRQDGITKDWFLGPTAEGGQCRTPGGHGHTEPDKQMCLSQARVAKLLSGCLWVANLFAGGTRECERVSGLFSGLWAASSFFGLRCTDCSSFVQVLGTLSFGSCNPSGFLPSPFRGLGDIWTYWVCRIQCPDDLSSSAVFSSPLLGVLDWSAPPDSICLMPTFLCKGPVDKFCSHRSRSTGTSAFPYTTKAPKRRIGGSGPSALFVQLVSLLCLSTDFVGSATSGAHLCIEYFGLQQEFHFRPFESIPDHVVRQQGVSEVWGQTNTSVALGCCPVPALIMHNSCSRIPAAEPCLFQAGNCSSLRSLVTSGVGPGVLFSAALHFVAWLGDWLLAFGPPFLFVTLLALARLMLKPLGVFKTTMGKVCLISAVDLPDDFLRPASLFSVTPRQQHLRATTSERSRERRQKRAKTHTTNEQVPQVGFSVASGLLRLFFCLTVPTQVWAAPKPWGEAVEIILTATRLMPEPFPGDSTAAPAHSPGDEGNIATPQSIAREQAENCNVPFWARPGFIGPPVMNAPDLPVPPLNETLHRDVPDEFVHCHCFVMALHFQAEVLSINVRLPASVDSFCNQARSALSALRLRYAPSVVPTFPQIDNGFASLVVVPLWLAAAGKQIVVFDLRPLGGAVYPVIFGERISYFECEQEAHRHGFRTWSVYAQGCTQALTRGESFLAVTGGVILFQPEGHPAEWRGPLQARLDRAIEWLEEPDTPDFGTEWPLYVSFHDRHMLASSRRFPGESIVRVIAELVERTPDRVLMVTPPGQVLENIDCHGVSCRDALAVYPLTPSEDRQCIVVFLDARQVGLPVTHIFLEDREVAPVTLVRFLDLRAPPGFRVAVWPRTQPDGRLSLVEGGVILFGFVPETFSESSDDESFSDSSGGSSSEGGESNGSGGSRPDGERSPNLATPAPDARPHFSNRNRSRSPRGAPNATCSPAAVTRLSCGVTEGDADKIQSRLAKKVANIDLCGFIDGHCNCKVSLHICDYFLGMCRFPFMQDAFEVGMEICTPALEGFSPGRQALMKPAWLKKGAASPAGVCTHKLLTEPICDGPNARRELSTLRTISEALGGSWPFTIYEHNWHTPDTSEAEGSSDVENDEGLIRWVTALVLKPLYQPEVLTIAIQFPTTAGEVLPLIGAARSAEHQLSSPHLQFVSPQPSDRTPVVLAMPRWPGAYVLVCFDLSRIDSRIFVVEVPEFSNRQNLLMCADLPPTADVHIFVGEDVPPLADWMRVRMETALTVTFWPTVGPFPDRQNASTLLRQGRTWSDLPEFEVLEHEGRYCLVLRYGFRLFWADREEPWMYRRRIAESVGVPIADLRLFPAAPRVGDVSVDGLACNTVLIGVPGQYLEETDAAFCFVLDCRRILLGWICMRAQSERFPIRLILDELREEIPHGWIASILGVRPESEFVEVSPGTVLTIAVLPQLNPGLLRQAMRAPHPARDTDPPHSGGTGDAPSDGASDQPERDDRAGSLGGSDHDAAGDDLDQVTHSVRSSQADLAPFTAVFLVLVPSYVQELFVLQLVAPATVDEVKAAVQDGRSAQGRRRFPHLCEVFPQPDTAFGVLVAVPDWDCIVAFVVVDARHTGGRLFSAAVPARADRSLLLSACGFDPNGQFVVYTQDTPWQLADGFQVRLAHGDLVLVTVPDHPVIVSASLADMLQSARGWASLDRVPAPDIRTAWCVLAPPHFGLRVPLNSNQQLQRIICEHFSLTTEDVVVSTALPGIVDHSLAGQASGSVFHVNHAATQSTAGTVCCILDLRPIVGGLESVTLPEGLFDGLAFLDRFLAGVPFGFGVGVFGGHPSFGAGPRQVQEGTVLTVEYLTDDQRYHLRQQLSGHTAPNERWTGYPPAGTAGSNTWTNRSPHHRPRVSPVRENNPFASGLWNFLRQLFQGTPRHHRKSARRSRGAALACRCLAVGCLVMQPQTTLALSCAPATVSCVLQTQAVWSPAATCPCSPCTVSDKCAYGLVEDVRCYGPQWDTPVTHSNTWNDPREDSDEAGETSGVKDQPGRITFGTIGWALAFAGILVTLSTNNIRQPCIPFLCLGLLLCLQGVVAHPLPASEDAHSAQCSVGFAENPPFANARPVATPARSFRMPAVIDCENLEGVLDFQPEHLCTLLEQSVSDPESQAFFLASTLLETLCEHFEATESLSTVRSDTRIVVNLSDNLPSHVEHDVSQVALDTTLPFDQVAEFLGNHWFLPQVLPKDLDLHPATAEAFEGHVKGELCGFIGVTSIAIYTDGSFNGSLSTWAFAAIAESPAGKFLLAWARGHVRLEGQQWFIGAPDHSALSAERSAVFWATAWLFGIHKSIACSVHCDCLVAARQASGTYGSAAHNTFATTCRSLVQALEALEGFASNAIHHVRGHKGDPYNELADTLAGAHHIGESEFPASFRHLCQWATNDTLQWLWLSIAALTQPTVWPTVGPRGFVDPQGNTTLSSHAIGPADVFGPHFASDESVRPETSRIQIEALLVSVNVQSLCEDASSNLPNRVPFVRDQLDRIGCAVAGLQETRAKTTTTVTSASHIRFLSGRDDKGCLGVELWFSKTVPIGWVGNAPLLFAVDDFRVLHWTPRLLLVRFVKGTLRILFVTCHAPTATSPERAAWWKSFVDLLLRTAKGDKVVILGDLNARLCEPVANRVGTLVWEQEHSPPASFFRLVQELDSWVPSTFRECHHGPCHTWVAPGGTAVSRIDFIIIPASWGVPDGGSSVLYEVDFGQSGLDHFATQLSVSTTLTARLSFRAARQRFDCGKALQPEATEHLHRIMRDLPSVPWEVDAHQHYNKVVNHLLQELSRQFPVQRSTRRRTFFSDSTWSLRQQRLWLRRQAHVAGATLKSWDMQGAFSAWRWGGGLQRARVSLFSGALKCVAQLQHAIGELRKLRPLFRRSLRQDKSRYLSEVAQEAATSATKDVVQRLRPLLGPPRRKQRGAAPLPALRLEDGTLAATPEEAEARWLRHFSAAEFGGPVHPQVLIDRCYLRQGSSDLDALDVACQDLPSRCELEHAFRMAKPGRATGSDSVPPDLLHYMAGPMARVFYPILLKVAFRLQEPLHFKGGSIRHLWKQKGDLADCTSYRGILISSNVGKGFHSAFRRKCGAWFEAAASPLQVGGRRGFPVSLAAQAVRSYQAGHLRKNRSTAVIFLDLREAFHKVARPLVHGGDLSDAHIASVMSSMGLSPDHMHHLREYISAESLLIPHGASPWAAAVVKEFQSDSWMTVGHGLAIAEAGTRPGDSLADIIFSFLFTAVLRQVRKAMLQAGFDVRLPWSDCWFRSLSAEGEPATELAPIDVSWMDDLALLLSASSPGELVSAVERSASMLIAECIKALLHPNLDPGKTEALLSLVGRDSRKVRAELFRSAEPSTALSSTLWPTARLRLVPRYKHLGGILHCSGSLMPEVRTRCGQAWQSFRKHRRMIFVSPTVTHREKALLFHSLVLSSLMYGAGTWSAEDGEAVDKVQGTLVSMARQMLRPTFNFEAACHLGARKILAVARIPSAKVLLHIERLRHLGVVVRVAPQEFWAIVHHGTTWGPATARSLEWLRATLVNAGRGQLIPTGWSEVKEVLLTSPNTWKKWIRVAQQTALLLELWEAEVQHFHGLLFRFLLSKGAVVSEVVEDEGRPVEVCAICQQCFPDLRSWSHHAFKRHGRVREARHVAVGTQCQVCLRHFATTFRLSNHLEHSRSCLAALVQHGRFVDTVPGRGSRGFNDGKDALLPAVLASGPSMQWSGEGFVPEAERPAQSILDGLTEIFCQPSQHPDFQELVSAVRSVFLGVCLQRSRLRATAKAWQAALLDELAQDEDVSLQWAAWHTKLAEWMCRVDFSEWLVPDSPETVRPLHTVRDSTVLLPWLSFDSLLMPGCAEPDHLGFRVIAAGRGLLGKRLCKEVQGLSHIQCMQSPHLLDFDSWVVEAPVCVIGFCLQHLLPAVSVPLPVNHYKGLAPSLGRLRLFADLVRGVLYLWSRGRPALLVTAPVDCPGLTAVKKAAPFTSRLGEVDLLSNFQDVSSVVSRFTI